MCSSDLIHNSFFLFFKINLFIYFWLYWVFVATCRLSLVEASGGYSSLQCRGLLIAVGGLLIVVASLVVEHGL